MKKILSLVLVAIIGFSLVGCGKQDSKVLNIGITDYPPMNYYEKDELVGFETEFAKEVCKELGLTANFIEISWDSKEVELKSKNIDAIWNGMSWTEERAENMLLSDIYMQNRVAVVAKKDKTINIKTDKIAVEKGSFAEEVLQENKSNIISVDSMTKGFMEVSSGSTTATACDYIAAIGMLGEKSDYKGLEIKDITVGGPDKFTIGFRKDDTELCGKVNEIIAKMKADGRLQKIAEKYGLIDLL